ncbi:peptidoglycan DD-metalloendopeptidase family protein [Patescibacteria group bacterium]
MNISFKSSRTRIISNHTKRLLVIYIILYLPLSTLNIPYVFAQGSTATPSAIVNTPTPITQSSTLSPGQTLSPDLSEDESSSTPSADLKDETNISSPSAEIIIPDSTFPGESQIQPALDGVSNIIGSGLIRKKVRARPLPKKSYQPNELIRTQVENIYDASLHATVKYYDNTEYAVTLQKETFGDGADITIYPRPGMKPGKYTLYIYKDDESILEQDFTWGVLAVNTNKTVYHPQEEAFISIAVLNEMGVMVCNADLGLRIESEDGLVNDILTTADGSIIANPECNIREYHEKPDYETRYEFSDIGIYHLTLTAKTKNGTYTITDTIPVRDSIHLDVERTSATRLYPPLTYSMKMSVVAERDFRGKVAETVPTDFTISQLQASGVRQYDNLDTQLIDKKKKDRYNPADINIRLPFDGKHPISLEFGERYEDQTLIDKVLTALKLQGHDGIDFDIPMNTQVVAVDDGVVEKTSDVMIGTSIVIKHSWGRTYYGHLDKILVEDGQVIEKDQIIAESGDTGISTGPHLHFSIKPDGSDIRNGYGGKVDPMKFLVYEKKGEVVFSTNGDKQEQVISWDIDVKKGETITLGYEYKVPGESPNFYLVGPLTFTEYSGLQVFKETRQWQLAVDANVKIRQELNIIDGIVTAAGDDSAIVQLDTTQYNGTLLYYFEVVAKVDSGTLTMALERVGTTTQDSTVSVTATSYTRYRSTAFTPPASTQTEYNINLSGGTNPMVKAARIIVIQEGTWKITDTETQIEIGNLESGKTNTSDAALDSPKYWYYDSSKWDGTVTFYAEVSYVKEADTGTTTDTYTSTGSWPSVPAGVTSVTAEIWGGGAAGGGGNVRDGAGGGGGGGGAYSKKVVAVTPSGSYPVTVGALVSGGTGDGASGNLSSFVGDASDTASANGGTGGDSTSSGSAGGPGGTTGGQGTTKWTGGDGYQGAGTVGGGGGESAGASSDGTDASSQTGASGLADGGDGGNGGNANADGVAGTAPGGGGGGGGGRTGGSKSGGDGARGQVKLTYWDGVTGTVTIKLQEDDGSFGSWGDKVTIVSAASATTADLVRSTSFTPTTGRNYRIVASGSSAQYAIYNAKIIVQQTSATYLTKMEPQYLVANTTLSAGTSLQDFDTYFDPAEFQQATVTYIHEANSVSAGTSDVKLQYDPGGTPTDVTSSTITDVIQREQSSSMTMPVAAETIDVIATTNNDDIYASRILAQVVVSVPTITISGTTNVSSGTVAVAVDDTKQGQTGSISTGTWSITGVEQPDSGGTVTVFVDGAALADKTTGVTEYDGSGDIENMVLNKHYLTIGSDDTTPTLTVTDLDQYQYSDDAEGDVMHSVSASNLTVDGGSQFSDEVIDILSGDTLTIGSSETLTALDVAINGILTGTTTATFTITGSWDNNATFNAGTSTVTFAATSGTEAIDSSGASTATFNNLILGTSGTTQWNLGSALDVNGDLSINYGTLSQNGANTINLAGSLAIGASGLYAKNSTTAFTFDGSTTASWTDSSAGQDMGAVTINGSSETVTLGSAVKATSVNVASSQTLGLSSYTLTLTGSGTGGSRPFIATGTFTASTGTLAYTGTSNTEVEEETYNNLTLAPSNTGSPTYTLGTAGSQTITVGGNLTLGDGTYAVNVTTTDYSPDVDITGNIVVNSSATLTGSGTGTITTNGTLSGGGTINLSGGSLENRAAADTNFGSTTGSNDWTFNNLSFSNSNAGGGGGTEQQRDPDGAYNVDDAGDPGGISGSNRNIMQTSEGTLYSVIMDDSNCEVWMSYDGGASWAEQDGSNRPAGTYCNGAIDNTDLIHIIYKSSLDAKYVTFNTKTNAYGTPETADTASVGINEPVISVDSANKPHIAWIEFDDGTPDSAVYYTNKVTGSWKASVTVEDPVGAGDGYSNIAIINKYSNEDTDWPIIAFINNTDDYLQAECGVTDDAGSFNGYDVDTDVNDVGGERGVSLGVDSANNLWIAYVRDDGSADDITLARRDYSGEQSFWTSYWTIDITNSNVGYEPSMSVVGSDMYVFYEEDSSDEIVYDKYDYANTSWSGETQLATGATTYQDVHVRWSNEHNNDGYLIDYIYSDGTDIFWDYIDVTPVNINTASNFDDPVGTSRQVVRASNGDLYSFVNDTGICEIWKSTNGTYWFEQNISNHIGCDTYGAVAMAIDANDILHLVYEETDVRYDTFTTSTDTFGVLDEQVFTNGALSLSIAIDSSNIPHVAVSEDVFSHILYDNRVGGTWKSIPNIVVNDVIDGYHNPNIEINKDNYPVIAYLTEDTTYDASIAGADRNNPTDTSHFTNYAVDTEVLGSTTTNLVSLAIDSSGNEWISYVDEDGTTDYVTIAKHAYGTAWDNGSNWTSDITNSKGGFEPSIAIAGSGDVYVFYQNDETDQQIAYIMYNGTSWSGETALNTKTGDDLQDVKAKSSFEWNNYGANRIDYLFSDGTDIFYDYLYLKKDPVNIDDASDFTSEYTFNERTMVRNSNGDLYVLAAHNTSSLEIWKSVDNGSSWAEMDDTNNPNDAYAYDLVEIEHYGIAVDSHDILHIIYLSNDAIRDLKYVTFDTSDDTWDSAVIIHDLTDTGDDANYPQITIDDNDIPHISYSWSDSSLSTIYYCYGNKIGGSWTTNVQMLSNASGQTYQFQTITIDKDNYPQVAVAIVGANDLVALIGDDNDPDTAGQWTSYTIDSSIRTYSIDREGSASIGIDSSGNTWISYVDDLATDLIYLAKHTYNTTWDSGDNWSTTTNSNPGYVPSTYADDTNIYVFYENDQDDIVFDLYDGSSWSEETLVDQHSELFQPKVKWSYINNYDSTGTASVQTNTYYFSGSVAEASDTDNVWNSETNTDDGSITTNGFTDSDGLVDSNEIKIKGTNSPSINSTITSVKARMYYNLDMASDTASVGIYSEGEGALLGTASGTSVGPGWSSYDLLDVPSGGWDWDKVAVLEANIYCSTLAPGDFCYVYKVEILVESTNTDSQAEIDYVYSDGTDVFYNRVLLGGTASPVVFTSASGGSGDIVAGGNFIVGSAADTNTTTFENDTNDRILDLVNFEVATSSAFAAASGATSFTVAGNFSNYGTFTHSSGTITFDDAAKTSMLLYGGETTFNNLSSTTGGKAFQFDQTNQTTIDGTFTLTGSNCTTGRIFLDSMINNDAWSVDATGSVSVSYVDVEDSTAVTALTANHSTEDDDVYNTGWTVNIGDCAGGSPTLDQLLRHGLWFSGGTKQPFTF